MKFKARVFAYYLPQFHPIPENDIWWGKGFTEWTNVGKASRLYPGHYQPHVPADLGYYDLRVPEVREEQANIAKEHGVEGFIYWHYWFGNGKRLLERPLNEVINRKEPYFPFALAWANESWKGFAHGLKNRNVLIEQTYPGDDDYIAHFYEMLPAFKDERYIKVNNKLLFVIYKPFEIPDVKHFVDLWQKLAYENNLNGFYFIAHQNQKCINEELFKQEILSLGFDAVNFVRIDHRKYTLSYRIFHKIARKLFKFPKLRSYKKNMKYFTNNIDRDEHVIPSIIPGWDHTPRSNREGLVLTNSTPKYFGQNIKNTLDNIMHKSHEERIIIVKSWNEWAEGNYLEPDQKWGKKYLEVLKSELEL